MAFQFFKLLSGNFDPLCEHFAQDPRSRFAGLCASVALAADRRHATLRLPMPNFALPGAAVPAEITRPIRLQIVSPSSAPPEGDGWLHEVKHDGHRLLAIVTGDGLQLVSRNGHDRTQLFREPFEALAGLPPLVLDGEIAVPDERGVTHIDALTAAIRQRRPERLAYFAFDLLHLDGHDLRRCPIEDRKMLLHDVIAVAGCPRLVTVDHIVGQGAALFEAMRQHGGEGIVSKRAGSMYRGGESRDWLKMKCHQIGTFAITGYIERQAIYVAEERDGALVPAGTVKFGLAGRGLWRRLDRLRDGLPARKGYIPVRPELVVEVKFFGRYHRGWIRDGVLLSVG